MMQCDGKFHDTGKTQASVKVGAMIRATVGMRVKRMMDAKMRSGM